jgi:predicted anti-sigma-YlaC factor YlaD
MNCKKVKKNLAGYLEKNLPENMEKELENHLESCPVCSHLWEEFSQLWGALENRERIQPSPYFWARLKQRITEYEEGRKPIWGWLQGLVGWARPAVAVAVLLICVFLGYSLGNFSQVVNGQTTSQVDERTLALQEFFNSPYLNSLNDLPTGSVEATYLEMISGE